MELLSILQDYLVQENTDYSLLISGEWGCGKTFFLKKTLFPEIEKINIQVINDKKTTTVFYEPLYVSLFGIKDTSEIDKRVFLELNPRFKSKSAFAVNFLVNKFAGIIPFKGLEKEDYKEYLSVYSIPRNKILCFDDLERIDKEILNEVLGYINSFVEHQNVKVIIVGDENILREKVIEYNKIKEKLIRFTYAYSPDIINVYDDFISSYSTSYSAFLKKEKEFICQIYSRGKHKNLRTLRFNLDLFEKIFKAAESLLLDIKYKTEIIDRLLFFSTTYSIEYKKTNDIDKLQDLKHLSSQNISNFSKIKLDQIFDDTEEIAKDPPKEDFSETFKNTYLPFGNHFFDYYDVVAEFIHTGYLSQEKLKKTVGYIITELTQKEQTEETIILNKLTNLFSLRDNELKPLIKNVLDKVKKGVFELPAYPNIYTTLLNVEYYKINDLVIDEDKTVLFEKGMDIWKERGEYIENFRYKIPFFDGRNEKYERICNYSIKTNEYTLTKKASEYAPKILSLIENNEEQELKDYVSNIEYKQLPIFSFLDPMKVFSRLSKAENATIYYFRDGLDLKYSYDFANDCTRKESVFFITLLDIINSYIEKSKPVKISTVAFINLRITINKIVSIRELQ